MVGSFVYQLGFVGKSLQFEMLEFVEVFVCDILVYMVQKYLVDNNRHHRMINSLYNRVFVVYFYFVEKLDSFRYDPVRDVDGLGSLLSLLMYLGNSIFLKLNDLAYFFEEDELFVMDLRNYYCLLVNVFRVFNGFVIGLYV